MKDLFNKFVYGLLLLILAVLEFTAIIVGQGDMLRHYFLIGLVLHILSIGIAYKVGKIYAY